MAYMDVAEYLRVVSLRKGKLKATEFRLRPGERGLSLFRREDRPGAADIVAAVHASGKQGDLAAAVFPADGIRALGLVLVATPGGTGVSDVDKLHVEARLPFWRALIVRLRGRPLQEEFNDRIADRSFEMARLVE